MAVSVVLSTSATLTASRSPSVNFSGYTPQLNDVVVLFSSSSAVTGCSDSSGWINVLGSGFNPSSDVHSVTSMYHLVTAGDVSGVTTTYTATNFWDSVATGNVLGCVLRGVDTAAVIDSTSFTSDSDDVTSHGFNGLGGVNLSSNSLVLGYIAKAGVGAYASPPSGWSFVVTSNANQGTALVSRNVTTSAGVTINAIGITPSGADEFASVTAAFSAIASAPAGTTQFFVAS